MSPENKERWRHEAVFQADEPEWRSGKHRKGYSHQLGLQGDLLRGPSHLLPYLKLNKFHVMQGVNRGDIYHKEGHTP